MTHVSHEVDDDSLELAVADAQNNPVVAAIVIAIFGPLIAVATFLSAFNIPAS